MIMRIRIIIVTLFVVDTRPSGVDTRPSGVDTRPGAGRQVRVAAVTSLICGALLLTGCGRGGAGAQPRSRGGASRILAVGAESEYAKVIAQIGGRYVFVSAIMSNPNTDPHSFEASPGVAQTVSAAKLIVQNGAGYDSFMNRIESASASASRRVIDVQRLLGLSDATRNPHLWYEPTTMPKVAAALAKDLAALAPAHAAYFRANARRFDASLRPWLNALARFRRRYRGAPVATTEPVADYMLEAAGADDLTPWSFQADVMNGVDPAPQDISLEDALFKQHRAKAFLYNRQVTDTLTQSFLTRARRYHVPVVAVYETMPSGYDYQSWMLAEVKALERAVAAGKSTTRLG
jgi:zinc/manganese transport system substrate-binding protein